MKLCGALSFLCNIQISSAYFKSIEHILQQEKMSIHGISLTNHQKPTLLALRSGNIDTKIKQQTDMNYFKLHCLM